MPVKLPKKNHWKFVFALAILVIIAYANSFNNAFVSDDIPTIRDNPDISRAGLLSSPPFFQVAGFLDSLAYKAFGLNPAFYRLVNILFHFGSVCVVYFLMNLLFSAPLPFFTAALFAVHPVLTEAVTWISGGPYAQYAFFLLLSLFFYIRGKEDKQAYFISLFVFLFALLSGEKAMVFPLILIFWEIASGNIFKGWKKTLPFFILSAIWVVIFLSRVGQRIVSLETQYYQKTGIDNPLIQIPVAITSYLQLIFWPGGLTIYHSEMAFSLSAYLVRLAVFVLFLAAIIYSYKRQKMIFFWLSFFVVSLFPTLTPLRISWIVAERYVYLGALGIFVVAAMILQRLSQIKNLKILIYSFFALIIICLCVRTIIRNIDWKNEDNLWLATAKISPGSPNNHNNLGDVYSRHGDLKRAAEEFKRAIDLKPNYADAYHNLANTYLDLGQPEDAIKNYQKAIFYNPNLWQSYQNLAGAYFKQKKYDLALESLLECQKITPRNSFLYFNLGIAYLKLGYISRAKEQFKKAQELNPQDPKIKRFLEFLP